MMKRGVLCIFILIGLASCRDEEVIRGPLKSFSLEWPAHFPPPPLRADNPLTEQGVALGKKLFFDPILSSDRTQSCASCHHQPDGFTDRKNALSRGVLGQLGTRNSMPLFNLLLHNNGFFWDGRSVKLREQALIPIQDHLEMNENLPNVVSKLNDVRTYRLMFDAAFGDKEITPERIGLALEQYMYSLVSGDSKFDRVQRGLDTFSISEKKGQILFNTEFNPASGIKGADCFHCHGDINFTNNEYLNNGLDSVFTDKGRAMVTGRASDEGKFKVPSLRNVEVTGPYMHDGRFKTLEEVVEHYNSGIRFSSTLDPNMHTIRQGLQLTASEKRDLINFMKTLTDQTYLNNPKYR
jgi:cytochrome c peroxidase